jgi:hypothetical protein
MFRRYQPRLRLLSVLFLALTTAHAQGPGSCGLHLDVLADRTSTHASISGMPGAPGSGTVAMAPGEPGNPYSAYATPGSPITVRLSLPGGLLGPAPFGPGSKITLGWSLATPNIPVAASPPLVSPCQPGQAIVVSVLPLGGVLVDGVGLFGPAPLLPPVDPGYPDTWSMTLLYPLVPMPLPPVIFQAVVETPLGIAISNAVSILPGSSPHETSLKPALTSCGGGGGFAHLRDGSTTVPTPPGFTFYGVPAPIANVHVDGFLDFLPPGFPAPCDPTGEYGDFGGGGMSCGPPTPEARPRIDVNHFDGTMGPHVGSTLISDLTREVVPPTATVPARVILRWKNLVDTTNFSSAPYVALQRASFVCELWGDGRIVICRQFLEANVSTTAYGQMGIGPGFPGQGFATGPSTCWSLAFSFLYGGAGFPGAPGDILAQGEGLLGVGGYGLAQGSLSVAFDPIVGLPGAYTVSTW